PADVITLSSPSASVRATIAALTELSSRRVVSVIAYLRNRRPGRSVEPVIHDISPDGAAGYLPCGTPQMCDLTVVPTTVKSHISAKGWPPMSAWPLSAS